MRDVVRRDLPLLDRQMCTIWCGPVQSPAA